MELHEKKVFKKFKKGYIVIRGNQIGHFYQNILIIISQRADFLSMDLPLIYANLYVTILHQFKNFSSLWFIAILTFLVDKINIATSLLTE